MNIDLSIIIISYNTKDLTTRCLDEVTHNLRNAPFQTEIILVDNGSHDGSQHELRNYSSRIKSKKISYHFIPSDKNLGFGKANNLGLLKATGKYVLFLNSDVMVGNLDFEKLLQYMDKNENTGVLTVKVILANDSLDMACHRGFPTLWRSFTYFSKLEPLSRIHPFFAKIFGGYHLLDHNFNAIHEIDSPTGAFYLTRKHIMDSIGGFDPDYFFYGEDLDMSYRIKQMGYRIIYYPLFSVLHLKNQSGIKSKDKKTQNVTRTYFFEAMAIFYRKHFEKNHLGITNRLVYLAIEMKKKIG